MRSKFSFPGTAPAITWVGLPMVYSSAIWGYYSLNAFRLDHPLLGALLLARALLTALLGVGLAAGERLAWATAVGWCSLLAGAGAVCGFGALDRLRNRPLTATSWEPLYLGLPYTATLELLVTTMGAALLGSGLAWLLWRERGHFDVQPGRGYSALLPGGVPAIAGVVLDAFWTLTWRELRLAG